MVVVVMVWQFIFDLNLGFLLYWLFKIGIYMGDVFGSIIWVFFMVIVVGVWKNFGYFMVIFFVGL